MTSEPSANYLAPDGYRYGVMHNDGSVSEVFNGRTQRERAAARAAEDAERFAPDNITLARRLPGQPWERLNPPEPKKPARDIANIQRGKLLRVLQDMGFSPEEAVAEADYLVGCAKERARVLHAVHPQKPQEPI